MFCQQSVISDAVSGLSISKVPVGNNLNGPNPSLPKIDGSIALDFSSQQLYYVGGSVWKTFGSGAISLSPVGAAPNANAATITGTVLNLQPASVAFPGVVTTTAQSFNGTKTFSAIIAPGTNYITANPIVGSVANDGLTIDNVANTVALEFADATHNGIVSTTAQTYTGIKTFVDGIKVDGLTPSVPIVANVFNLFYQVNFNGIDIPTYTGCVTTGTKEIVATNFKSVCTLAFGQYLPGAGVYGAGLINAVFPASANPGNPGALPVEFAPNTDRKGIIMVVDGGVAKVGGFNVDALGFVTIGTGFSASGALLNFTANGDNGLLDSVGTYF